MTESKNSFADPMNNKDYFDWLSDEVLLRIFGYLEPRDLFHLAQVNKRCNKITDDRKLWTRAYIYLKDGNSICPHTVELLMNKPVVNLEIDSDVSTKSTECQRKAHAPPELKVNQFLSTVTLNYCGGCYLSVLTRILKKCGSVKVLSLYVSKNISFGDTVRRLAEYCNNLEVLDLDLKCKDRILRSDDLKKLSKLTELKIRCHVYSSVNLNILPPQIRKLDCTFNTYGLDCLVGDIFIAGLTRRCPRLRELILEGCEISDMALEFIAKGLRHLERLKLYPYTDLVGDLSELEGMKNLKVLSIMPEQRVSDNLRAKVEIEADF